ncbi:hypothetical protein GQX74_011804 [Glossina fuscipes]|nr:hypothetical protein GQX74_011804 [Glossina fuscipes]
MHLSVSWIRKRDLHILTAGSTTYTSDQRFQCQPLKGNFQTFIAHFVFKLYLIKLKARLLRAASKKKCINTIIERKTCAKKNNISTDMGELWLKSLQLIPESPEYKSISENQTKTQFDYRFRESGENGYTLFAFSHGRTCTCNEHRPGHAIKITPPEAYGKKALYDMKFI